MGEVEFDGEVLSSRPGPTFPGPLAAKGLPKMADSALRLERAIFVGLPARPERAELLQGSGEVGLLTVTSERAAGGAWVATVKKPLCQLGEEWSLRLSF